MLIADLLLPIIFGILFAFSGKLTRKLRNASMIAAFAAEALLVTASLFFSEDPFVLFSMTDTLVIKLSRDNVSGIFLMIAVWGFLFTGVYASRYMEHEEREGAFYSFLFFSEAALVGMDLADNLITMYLFYEMVSLLSMPLVLHERTQESIRAAMKYLFYSVGGAFLGLCALFVLNRFAPGLSFANGGILTASAVAGHEKLILIVVFLGIIGFGAKAGMYPLHGWLPTAHPAAPAPASAVLSGIIAKAGVLAVFRMIYSVVGTDLLRGTWVQYALISLALLTVFMGSMMAYRTEEFKKRLAYSSVSQISYILTGFFFMTPYSVAGGLLHVIYHACIKVCLFMTAGSFIVNTGKRNVSDFAGYGKSMPITLWSFTIASLGLIGIPPASGFVSKWYLACGALDSALPVLNWLAPVILLVSALLTAGYLLPITVRGFFPGHDFECPTRNDEGGIRMWLPIAILAGISLALGLFAGPLTDIILRIAEAML